MHGYRWRYVVACLLIAAAGLFLRLYQVQAIPLQRPLADFPRAFGNWSLQHDDHLDDEVLAILRPTDYLNRTYADADGSIVHLYIGYHGGGTQSGEIHSPKHCLPGGGWHRLDSSPLRLQLNGETETIVRALYQKGEIKELFLYWYRVGNQTLDGDFHLKLAQMKNAICNQRRDAAFIRISVQDRDNDPALSETVAIRFTREVFPLLEEFLPR